MKRLFLVTLVALFVSFLLATCAYAEVPHLIRFQGKLTDTEGAPLNGSYNITFRIYDAETGGALEWSETQSAVPVNNGIYTVLLGSGTALDLPFDEPYWLSMEVNDDGEMSPRQRISSVGYAIHAEVADSISGVEVIPSGAIIIWRGTSCPPGFSPVNDLQGKFLMGKADGESETTGGNATHEHGPGTYKGPSHTHSASSGQHTHSFTAVISNAGGIDPSSSTTEDSAPGTGSTGSGGTQSITGESASADSRPPFVTVLFCEKD